MNSAEHYINLPAIARATLLRYGFFTEPPAGALAELARLNAPDTRDLGLKDLTGWLWSSIDNDDSRDLDQIEYLRDEPDGASLFVGVADMTPFVMRGSELDKAAWHNTTSIYTGVRTFPMFPDKLSTNLTSLVEGQNRLAVVVEMRLTSDGRVTESAVYRAMVRNHAQLTYQAASAWLENRSGDGSEVTARMLGKIRANPDLQGQLRRQNALAGALRQKRLEAGALTFETIELRPEHLPNDRWDLKAVAPTVANHLIEDFMIAANQTVVAFLQRKGFPTFQRVVRTPKDWPRIVSLAAQHVAVLPAQPDAPALQDFLTARQQKDPERFPDLSLAVIKLLGRGEYAVAGPGGEAPGHFALAVHGYSHSTAPNRRYPDVITQRLVEAASGGQQPSYTVAELTALAQHCTNKENDANKAERSVHKSVAAVEMGHRIGEQFDGFITGAADKGTWVRLLHPPVEGRLDDAPKGLAVGDRVHVKLVFTDPAKGYIDFNLIGRR